MSEIEILENLRKELKDKINFEKESEKRYWNDLCEYSKTHPTDKLNIEHRKELLLRETGLINGLNIALIRVEKALRKAKMNNTL